MTMILDFVVRALRRLRFFPFTLGYIMVSAGVKSIEMWRGDKLVRLVGMTDRRMSPADLMVCLSLTNRGMPDQMFDLCLRVTAAGGPALHDSFSTLLTVPRLRSVAFYWEDSGLADDLALWQSRKECLSEGAQAVAVCEGSAEEYHAYFESRPCPALLPVAAMREAGTLLKRCFGGRTVVCLNLPGNSSTMGNVLAEACPDLLFIDLVTDRILENRRAANTVSLFGYGLSLHERLALVQAADAYFGWFDEFGCVALSLDRPSVLLQGSEWTMRSSQPFRKENAVWFPDAAQAEKSVDDIAEFFRLRLGRAESP